MSGALSANHERRASRRAQARSLGPQDAPWGMYPSADRGAIRQPMSLIIRDPLLSTVNDNEQPMPAPLTSISSETASFVNIATTIGTRISLSSSMPTVADGPQSLDGEPCDFDHVPSIVKRVICHPCRPQPSASLRCTTHPRRPAGGAALIPRQLVVVQQGPQPGDTGHAVRMFGVAQRRPQDGVRIALGHIGADVGRGLAAGQFVQHRVGPGVVDLASTHLCLEGGLGGVVDGGELGEAILREMGRRLGHHLGVGVVPALVAQLLEFLRRDALAAVAEIDGPRLGVLGPQRGEMGGAAIGART